jgi:predicted permease
MNDAMKGSQNLQDRKLAQFWSKGSVVRRIRAWFFRMAGLFHKETSDRELTAEMESHLQLHIEDNLRAGMNAEQARRQALIKLGGLEQAKESIREQRGFPLVDALMQDLRYALRLLRNNPGFSVVAVVALALGIGFSSVIFSVFYNGVLRPFPYRDSGRLTAINLLDTQNRPQGSRSMFHLDEVAAFRAGNQTFDDIVAYSSQDLVYSTKGFKEPEHGCALTPNAMDFWGVPPLLGRGLTEQDSLPGANPVVLLNYKFWKRMFQENKSVLGSTIMLNGQARTVIGVMPPRFQLYAAEMYVPIAWNRPEPPQSQAMDNGDPFFFIATGIRKRNVSLQTAAADLQGIAQHLVPLHRQDYPEHFRIDTRSMSEVIVGDFRQTLILLIAAVALLLLISSSNVASLLLAHTSARAKEIALRAALGASRSRLIRQLFVESLVLGAAGCVAGCLFAYLGLNAAVSLSPVMQLPSEADITLNRPVLLFAVGLSLLTTILFGLSPALFAVRKDLRTNLQSTGVNVNASTRGSRIRSFLVVGQVALSMLLLVFAGLMMRSFFALKHVDPGFHTENLLTLEIRFPPHQYDSAESKRAYFEQALARVAVLPGVANAAESWRLPLRGGPTSDDVTIPGKPHDKQWTTAFEACSESFFQTLGVQLLEGRLLSPADIAGARRVAVVNRTLAKSFFGNENPLGQQIKFKLLDDIRETPHNAYFEIIGVVSDFKNSEIQDPTLPEAFVPYTFSGFADRGFLVRTTGNPSLLMNSVRQVLTDVDPDVDPNPEGNQPITVDEFLQQNTYVKPRFRSLSFGICAITGLALALIGLFGVMAYSVSLQTHELGVRMALGAQTGNILALVLRKGLLLVGGGVLLGLLAAFFSVRILQSQLWGVSAFDPGAFVLAPLALLTTGLLACYVPARRAARIDPLVALRYE